MNAPDCITLIHRDLDGELSAEEKAHLQQILTDDIKMRRIYDHLVKSTAAVGKIPQHAPPDDLVNNVMSHIDPSRYLVRRSKIIESLITFLEPRRRMAIAFASLILMVVVFTYINDHQEHRNVSDLTGTIGMGKAASKSFTLAGETFNGHFRLYLEAQKYILEGGVEHTGTYKIRIQFYPAGSVKFIGQDSDTATFQTNFDQNTVLLENSGDDQFRLTFGITRNTVDYATIEVEATGEPSLTKKIILN